VFGFDVSHGEGASFLLFPVQVMGDFCHSDGTQSDVDVEVDYGIFIDHGPNRIGNCPLDY